MCLSFVTVCRGLIKNGERQDEESVGGRRRTEALRQLCQMNPSQALNIRAMAVSCTVNIITGLQTEARVRLYLQCAKNEFILDKKWIL